MRRIPLILILSSLLSACSTTATSKRVWTTADFDYLEWRGENGAYLKMLGVNHSTPTRAAGSVVGTATMGAASVIMAGKGAMLLK